jgi:hypothetical protein
MEVSPVQRHPGGANEVLDGNSDIRPTILSEISPFISLRIQKSTVQGEATGLFVCEDVPEGADIFRSSPLLTFAGWDGQARWQELICAQCYRFSKQNIGPSGNMDCSMPPTKVVRLCTGCQSVGYCSEVSSTTNCRKIFREQPFKTRFGKLYVNFNSGM